jgi:hypothetical protein
MSLEHLNRLAAAAGFAAVVGEDDEFGATLVADTTPEFVPLTRSHWPDAPAPRVQRQTGSALVPVGALWSSSAASAPAAWSATAAWAMRSVTQRFTGRSMPA